MVPCVSSAPLMAEFLDALEPTERPRWERCDDLAARIARITDQARAAWPQLETSAVQLVRHIAARVPRDRAPDEALEQIRAADLYLACACGSGEPIAVVAFERTYLRTTAIRMRGPLTGYSIDDLLQTARELLLVGDGKRPPRITVYAGRGDLRMFVRAVISRIAIDAARSANRSTIAAGSDPLLAVPSGSDPETQYLKTHYQVEFKSAFERAARSLSHRQRNLLRHQVVFGLSIDQIAAIYHVHRSTVARWLEEARHALVARTREALLAKLEIDDAQVDSILQLIQSQIDVSLRRTLDPGTDGS
jgi:RNA polymerase sigma-70 factor (ECF subfamily)